MSKKPLTDAAIKALKPKDKMYKTSEGSVPGLQLIVYPTGKKVFRLGYLFNGTEQLITLGGYPEFSLAEARVMALSAKQQVAHGENPAAIKKASKEAVTAQETTFRVMTDRWLSKKQPGWSQVHIDDVKQKLNLHILPAIGSTPMADVTKLQVKQILDRLQAQAKYSTLKKVRNIISQIFRHALAEDAPGVVADWTVQLVNQYTAPEETSKHRAAITTPKEVGALMRAITAYSETSPVVAAALKFSALTFARPGEVRRAEWSEIDLEHELWRIPAAKMKMRQPHLVPLAKQTLAVLEMLRPLTGHSVYLFPAAWGGERPMSEGTVLAALRRMGYTKEQMCAHGFRGMASTLLNESGFNRDWIERQLAHAEQNKVRAAYQHSEFLANRKEMMQWWANRIEKLEMS